MFYRTREPANEPVHTRASIMKQRNDACSKGTFWIGKMNDLLYRTDYVWVGQFSKYSMIATFSIYDCKAVQFYSR